MWSSFFLFVLCLLLCCMQCLADCSAPPPTSVYSASIAAGSTSTIASITCPTGQTAVNTYWDVRSTDGTSPFTFVVSDARGARDTVGPGTCTYAHEGLVTLSSYAAMSASVTCNNPTHFLGIGNQNCPISHAVGWLCTPFPPVNFQGCQTDLSSCPASSTMSYNNPSGGVNVMNQFCCADGTAPVVDNTANTCHCGPVVLSSPGYANNHTYWIAPNATSVWISAPTIAEGSGQYSSTISPSLTGTGLTLQPSGAISLGWGSQTSAHPRTAYTVTIVDTYNTGVAALTLPISIAIEVETFSWMQTTAGTCSASCGGGTQSVTYGCVDQDGTVADNSQCSPSTLPPSTTSCNTQACAGTWVQTSAGACSAPCGGGVHSITYACEDAQGSVMSTSECPSSQPAASAPCNTQVCQLPWAGTYVADQTCSQSQCCCVEGNVVITESDSLLIIDVPQLAGQCEGQTTGWATVLYPSAGSFTTTLEGDDVETVTMSGDQQSISVVDPAALACATTLTRTTNSNGGASSRGTIGLLWLAAALSVIAARI